MPEIRKDDKKDSPFCHRIRLTVAYDGTAYCGSQLQNNGPTIEGELHKAIESLTGTDVKIISASRTDAGVHSMGNVFVFDTQMRMPADKFSFALNQRLPDDIVVQDSREVEPDWHPRHCDSIKTYEYRIWNAPFPDPIKRNTALFYHHNLDVERMKEAAAYFIGEHDFASFCSSGSAVKTTVRTVYACDVFCDPVNDGNLSLKAASLSDHEEAGAAETSPGHLIAETNPRRLITIRVSGGGFLYNMVRIMAGTLIQVGSGERAPEEIPEILAACDRTAAGPTAPAHGLMMLGIKYDDRR